MKRRHNKLDHHALEIVAAALASITSPEEMMQFLTDLLTPGELCDITLRWRLLDLLTQGMTQRKIADELQISLCKITRGSKILKRRKSVTAQIIKAQHEQKKEG